MIDPGPGVALLVRDGLGALVASRDLSETILDQMRPVASCADYCALRPASARRLADDLPDPKSAESPSLSDRVIAAGARDGASGAAYRAGVAGGSRRSAALLAATLRQTIDFRSRRGNRDRAGRGSSSPAQSLWLHPSAERCRAPCRRDAAGSRRLPRFDQGAKPKPARRVVTIFMRAIRQPASPTSRAGAFAPALKIIRQRSRNCVIDLTAGGAPLQESRARVLPPWTEAGGRLSTWVR